MGVLSPPILAFVLESSSRVTSMNQTNQRLAHKTPLQSEFRNCVSNLGLHGYGYDSELVIFKWKIVSE